MSAPAIYTAAEAAERVGASKKFVLALARQRRVAHLRVGRGAVRFTAEQLDALVEHLTHEPTTPAGPVSLTTTRSRARRSS